MPLRKLKELLEWNPAPINRIVGSGIMDEGSKVILYGKYKSFKSMMALNFCTAVASGEPWLGFDTIAGGTSVLYLQSEVPEKQLRVRLQKLVGEKRDMPVWFWTEHNLKLDTDAGLAKVKQVLADLQPKVFIIDPVYKVFGGNLNESHQVRILIDAVDELISIFGISVMMVSHTRKGLYEEWGSDDLIGSITFSNWADSVLKVTRDGDDGYVAVSFDLLRHAEEEVETRHFRFDSNSVRFVERHKQKKG